MFVIGLINDTLWKYTLSSAYDLSTASYSGDSFSLATQDGGPYGITFKTDGLKLYIVGTFNDNVYEYDLTAPYDITTLSYNQSFSIATQETSPTGVELSPDGAKMYVVGLSSDSVHEYDLSTAWDISTATFSSSFSVSAQTSQPNGIRFNNDGSIMYVGESGGINQYNLSVAYDISTASFDKANTSFNSTSFCFSEDGAKFFKLDTTSDAVSEYDLSTNFDTTTASLVTTFSIAAQDTIPSGLFLNYAV